MATNHATLPLPMATGPSLAPLSSFGVRQRVSGPVGLKRCASSSPSAREHSRKPDEVHARIEALCGDVPRLELFGRESRPGWTVYGDEATKFDLSRPTMDSHQVAAASA